MCISTAYEGSVTGKVIAEYVERVATAQGAVVLTDIMGRETTVEGCVKLVDLTHGVVLIDPRSDSGVEKG